MEVGEGNKKQMRRRPEGPKSKCWANVVESQENDAGDTKPVILALIPGIVEGKADRGRSP